MCRGLIGDRETSGSLDGAAVAINHDDICDHSRVLGGCYYIKIQDPLRAPVDYPDRAAGDAVTTVDAVTTMAVATVGVVTILSAHHILWKP